MKHSEVLKRYVNTGSQIPEKQYKLLSQSLQKSYMRMRGVVEYKDWEFYFLTDDEKIKYIESKGGKIWSEIEVYSLLYYSEDKDLIATKIIDVIGDKLNSDHIFRLVKQSKNRYDIITKIINVKGGELDYNDMFNLIQYSQDKDLIATKIIDVKGEELTPHDVDTLLKFTTDNIAIKIIQTKGNKLKNDDIYYLNICRAGGGILNAYSCPLLSEDALA